MIVSSLPFFVNNGFRSISSGPGEIEVFYHSRQIDGENFFIYHLVDSLKEKEHFWVTEGKKFTSLADVLEAYPILKKLGRFTKENTKS